MIQGYEIKNENVKAFDDDKGFINYKYQENIDDVFIQENIVNKIIDDITIKKLDKIQKEHGYNIRYSKKIQLISILSTTTLTTAICFIILYNIPLLALLFTLLISLSVNGILYLSALEPKNKLRNEINADTLEIEELEKLLEKEKTNLQELKNNKTKAKIIDKSNTFKERNKSRLEEIDNLKNLYRICGYYAKKLVKYQEKGILRDKMDDSFTEKDLVIIENVIKEKGPQLVKRKK